jgi:hypothetical protein
MIGFLPCRVGGCSTTKTILHKSLIMPEFEETQHRPDPREDYAPGQDSDGDKTSAPTSERSQKPRSRRRSQGFKKPQVADIKASPEPLKETPAVEAARPAPVSTAEDTVPATTPSPADAATEVSTPEPASKQPKRNFPEDDAQPEPSAEMLTRIGEIESRLAERKAERGKRQGRPSSQNAGNTSRERSPSPARPPRSASAGGNNRQRSNRERPAQSTRPKRSSRRSPEPGLLKKLTGFIGGLFNREKPLPPEPDLPPQLVNSGKAPADRGGSGRGRRRSSSPENRRSGNGPSRGANNSRHRGRSANRRDTQKDES